MDFSTLLNSQSPILMECAVSGRLQRQEGITLHPVLFNSPLIYSPQGRTALGSIYTSYLAVAEKSHLPIILCAPTWRLDKTRVIETGVPLSINHDAVKFMHNLKQQWNSAATPLLIGGLLAPKNDCYDPMAALSRKEAAKFHTWQIEELVKAGVDVIIAQTMPSTSEAAGMIDVLSKSGVSYVISFVINRFGDLLDNTPLPKAVEQLDQIAIRPPDCYMVNCAYPTFIGAPKQPEELFTRLLGIQANGSSKDHDQLDNAEQLHQDSLEDWGENMIRLHRLHRMKIFGGCCGTDNTHLEYIATRLTT